MTTTQPSRIRVAVVIDVHNETPLTVLIWARQSGHQLTKQLWDHGVLAHLARVEIDEIHPNPAHSGDRPHPPPTHRHPPPGDQPPNNPACNNQPTTPN